MTQRITGGTCSFVLCSVENTVVCKGVANVGSPRRCNGYNIISAPPWSPTLRRHRRPPRNLLEILVKRRACDAHPHKYTEPFSTKFPTILPPCSCFNSCRVHLTTAHPQIVHVATIVHEAACSVGFLSLFLWRAGAQKLLYN